MSIAPGSEAAVQTGGDGGQLPQDVPGQSVQGDGLPPIPAQTLSDQQTAAAPSGTSSAGSAQVSDTSGSLPAPNPQGNAIVAAAEKYLGVPYKWGGESAAGVDCSGLVQLAYRAAGLTIPRVSYQQASYGTTVPISQLRPGDLVAWDNNPNQPGADHIAIYAGSGRIIEAAHPGTNVRVRQLSSNEGAYGVRIGSNQ